MANSGYHMHGLDTEGVNIIKKKLEEYQKSLSDGLFDMMVLTKYYANSRMYFGKSTAWTNFTDQTTTVYDRLQPALSKLGKYIEQFDKVKTNYQQFATSSATNVAKNMKS